MRYGVAALAVALLGCGSNGDPGSLGEVGVYPEAGAFVPTDGGAAGPLDAHVEQGGVQVTVVAVGCAGSCTTVKAVATGGTRPYHFAWDDGTTNAVRTLCPAANTQYAVTVTDTGSTGEVPQPPQTAHASVMADVLTCSDDGGAPDGGGLCATNPSFEGTPSIGFGFDAPPWANCAPVLADAVWITNASMPLTPAGGTLPALAPTDGNTYLVIYSNAGVFEAASEPLCAPLRAGTTYSLRMDLASPTGNISGVTPGPLTLFGGAASCAQGEALWTSPVPSATWSTYCATFTPTMDATYLSLQSSGSGESYAYVDHLVSVAACP
jgi:hypothetical protein